MNDSNLQFITDLSRLKDIRTNQRSPDGLVPMIHNKFNEALLKAVDFAFNSLGKSCNKALHFHLKTTFQIKKGEIPNKTEKFHNALRLIFKDGAVFLERLIVTKLCEELGVEFEEKLAFDFVDSVSQIRNTVFDRETSFLSISSFIEKSVAVNHEGDRKKAKT